MLRKWMTALLALLFAESPHERALRSLDERTAAVLMQAADEPPKTCEIRVDGVLLGTGATHALDKARPPQHWYDSDADERIEVTAIGDTRRHFIHPFPLRLNACWTAPSPWRGAILLHDHPLDPPPGVDPTLN